MRYMIYVSLLQVLIASPVLGDGLLMAWGPSDLEGMSEERFKAAKLRSVDEILALNLKLTTWPEAYEVLIGADQHGDDEGLRLELVRQIGNRTEVKLSHTSRLIIWQRISSGEIFFEGKGLQVDDDLFTVAGRANWVLRNITGKDFGFVHPQPDPDDLLLLQARWKWFLFSDPVDEMAPRYPSQKRGSLEIRSPQAIHAFAESLRPSERKSAYTARLLKDLYGLDQLPDNPASPARMCDPDAYTRKWLAQVTGITEPHAHAWWAAWWSANKDKLVWNPAAARFEVGDAPIKDAQNNAAADPPEENIDGGKPADDTPLEARFVADVKWIEQIGRREAQVMPIGVDIRWLVGINIRAIHKTAPGFDKQRETILAVHSPSVLLSQPYENASGRSFAFKVTGCMADGRPDYNYAKAIELY